MKIKTEKHIEFESSKETEPMNEMISNIGNIPKLNPALPGQVFIQHLLLADLERIDEKCTRIKVLVDEVREQIT